MWMWIPFSFNALLAKLALLSELRHVSPLPSSSLRSMRKRKSCGDIPMLAKTLGKNVYPECGWNTSPLHTEICCSNPNQYGLLICVGNLDMEIIDLNIK